MLASWNIEPLYLGIELTLVMERYEIDVLCVQETRSVKADVFTERDYLVITSGTDDANTRSWSGVAFIVAPHCRWRVTSYCQVSDRLAYLCLRVPGGIF